MLRVTAFVSQQVFTNVYAKGGWAGTDNCAHNEVV